MNPYRHRLAPSPAPAIVAALVAWSAGAVQAQIVDEVDWRREGTDAVLQLRYATEVQFQRAVSTRSGDLTIVQYQLVTLTNTRLQQQPNQVLRVKPAPGLPEIEISDEPDRGERARRIVLRYAQPLMVQVRAGRGNRSIEIVLRGRGADLPAPQAAAPRPRPLPPAAPAPRPTPATPPSVAAAPAAPPRPAPAPAPAPGVVPPAATAPGTVAAPPVAAEPPPPMQGTPEVEARAAAFMAQARTAIEGARWPEAIEALNQLLELPPSSLTRRAQELVGLAQVRAGNVLRARAEFETFLKLFPSGEDSERVRQQLASLPAAPAPAAPPTAAAPPPEPEVTITGSTSMTHYGGNGQVRSRDFQDSPIAGLPQIAGEPQLSSDRTSQIYNDVDLNWRRRNAEVDQRFVLRDSYTTDRLRPDKSKSRLSALYFDHKSLTGGWNARLGRQSPTGGGVMGRYDGAMAQWRVQPRVKLGAVAGQPVDRFFDSRRRFWGVSADADQLLGKLGAGVYAIEQRIDGEIDRRALGLEMRWFDGGATVFAQFDYDLLIRGLNIASIQGTLILEDNTVFNALYDRRTLATLALGNALTFEDPALPGVLFRRIQDKLATTTLEALRDQIRRLTPTITQAQFGVTKPWSKNWQTAANVQLTNTGAIPAVPEVAGFENGRAATGNIVTVGAQLIGLNLYSARDTHVWSASVISSAKLHGTLVSYNNSSFVAQVWQVEPTLQFYRDRNDTGTRSRRWTPGLRVTYRGWERWALESSVTVEIGRMTRLTPDPRGPGLTITTQESTHRTNWSLGARYEF